MNITRIAVLAIAVLAAGAAAFLVRGMLGGGTSNVAASPNPNLVTMEILVAAEPIDPGRQLTVENVKWQAWPKGIVADDFMTKETHPDLNKAIEHMVVRAPLVAGEPITDAKVVNSESTGLMAASLTPGKRAISIPISAESGAGGFILPNDRVDVILTRDVEVSGEGTGDRANLSMSLKLAKAQTLLRDVRVLAIDQTVKQESDQPAYVAKTATLELTQPEAQLLAEAGASGTLSLSLRALGDDVDVEGSEEDELSLIDPTKRDMGEVVTIVRYGTPQATLARIARSR